MRAVAAAATGAGSAPRLTGLPPIVTPGARRLILGSMPGAASLAAQRYYAHPQNRFRTLLGAVLGDAGLPGLPYPARVERLHAAGIAVWDVYRHCQRAGSLDSAIVRGSEIPNDIAGFIAGLPRLQAVFLNGAAAARAYARHVQPALVARGRPLPAITLPSSSPANASQSLAHKLDRWRQLDTALGR